MTKLCLCFLPIIGYAIVFPLLQSYSGPLTFVMIQCQYRV